MCSFAAARWNADLIQTEAVAALAGRRIDPIGADEPHFPLSAVPRVRSALRDRLVAESPRTLVCSAACGADLIALDLANRLGIPAHIVLPFSEERFRLTSVTDRPGDWGQVFDSVVRRARGHGLLTILRDAGEGDAAYSAATRQIVAITKELAGNGPAIAIAVSDHRPRQTHDATSEFRELAVQSGFRIIQVDI